MKNILWISVLLFFAGCITPSRLGVRYQNTQFVSVSNEKRTVNPNIRLTVFPLTKEDQPTDVGKLQDLFIPYVYRNPMLTNLIQKYPTLEIGLEITPSETIKKTWIMDVLFWYPGCGYLPIPVPWNGEVNLAAKMSIRIPEKTSKDFQFSASQSYYILFYTYYRAGRILTEKYSNAYQELFEQISKYDFSEMEKNGSKIVQSNSKSKPEKLVEDKNTISDVDQNIPLCTKTNKTRYALIIGNEDYSSFQTGLGSEVNVDFAERDATVFKEYAIKVLGIPDENIIFKINARSIELKKDIDRLAAIAKNVGNDAELFFYYAGHGFPNENTKEPYLIPVDVTGSDLDYAIKISEVYKKLTQYESKSVTVFLDACFSGGARNQGLVATRGVKVKPKENELNGKLVVFSAASGEQSAQAYKEKKHGLFTYFLLQVLKDKKGDLSYGELSDYLTQTVGVRSLMINSSEQNPQTNVSPTIDGKWRSFRLTH